MRSALLAVLLAGLLATSGAVDRSKFRTCSQTGFCKRHREKPKEPQWRVVAGSTRLEGGRLQAKLQGGAPGAPELSFTARLLDIGAARVRIVEDDGRAPRWENPDQVLEAALRDSPTAYLATATEHLGRTALALGLDETAARAALSTGRHTTVVWASKDNHELALVLSHDPLRVDLYANGVHVAATNQRGLFYLEHRRSKGDAALPGSAPAGATEAASGRKILDWGEDGKPVYADEVEGTDHGEAANAELGDDAMMAAAEAGASGGGGGGGAGTAVGARTLAALEGEQEPDLWEENFNSHRDSKPNGPMSVGFDITFPNKRFVYGLPEHADSFSLRATQGDHSTGGDLDGGLGPHAEPYRLYNLDVFEYELWNPMALYGSIPFVIAHGAKHSGGVFWNNPTETFVDVRKDVEAAHPDAFGATVVDARSARARSANLRWMSESGVWDLFLFAGPTPHDVLRQYTTVVGTQQLPPRFALGYHQCRWNYKDEADVFAVDAKFEEHNFPYDVIWLDIEHTDGKRYFTWDARLFPNPAAMMDKLWARGHRMVTIIDPHIKRDGNYHIHREAERDGHYIKTASGGDFQGWCWPGSSSYLDFTSPKVRSWWADQFQLSKYTGSTLSLFTWNDMNEPSVFDGPEVSMHKDAKNLDNVEHREWHNLYGFYQQWATAEGQKRRVAHALPDTAGSPAIRPFVLSRAFAAGSQRFGAIWTGDNRAHWDHLKAASPMLLSIGVSGLTFSGADVGGFFDNPDAELLIRWYQAGSFQPFFRAHAHIDTKRREPWLFGDDTLDKLRSIVRTRYSFLPLWYTLLHESHVTGAPSMRPLWFEFPEDTATFALDQQWLVGRHLLVCPVVEAHAESVFCYFPGGDRWWNALTFEPAPGAASVAGGRTVPAPLGVLPVFQRGGSIVPRQMRPRRSSVPMANDPFTLVVALDRKGDAAGTLFLDDGVTEAYAARGAFALRRFEFQTHNVSTGAHPTLRSVLEAGSRTFVAENEIERIVVLGFGRAATRILATDATGHSWTVESAYDAAKDVLTLRKPAVLAHADWTVSFE